MNNIENKKGVIKIKEHVLSGSPVAGGEIK